MQLDRQELDTLAEVIVKRLRAYVKAGKRIFATSSFQTQSLPLLHMISQADCNIPVYYTNTGFLFPETIAFADRLTQQLGLRVIGLQRFISWTGRAVFSIPRIQISAATSIRCCPWSPF